MNTGISVWVDQQPLKQKLVHLYELIQKQIQLGHLESSVSPWNTSVFFIPQNPGKWRLLQHLRTVNACLQLMEALQPGLPFPTAVPREWTLVTVDLKDCFFTIALHPFDCQKFAVFIPSVNFEKTMKRYQWAVLPQGMSNSPQRVSTFCRTSPAKY